MWTSETGHQAVSRAWHAAAAVCVVLLIGACTLGTNTLRNASTSPETSASPTPSPSPSPSPSPNPLAIGNLPFHNGEVGLAYAAINLTASGGTTPYNWTVAAGTYPPGLVLASDGTVSGTSTTSGNFSFTVSVTDAQGQSANGTGKITVFEQMTTTQPCAAKCIIGAGCQKCGGFATVGRGASPYSYRIVGGAVPPGMTWSALSVGGPFPAGSYSLSVQITDALGGHATVNANWSIYSPATLNKGGDCIDTTSTPTTCAVRWTYSGGHPTVAPKLVILGYGQYCSARQLCQTPTAPPPGWAVNLKAGVVTLSAGSSACTVQYLGTMKLALADGTSCATTSLSNEADLIVDLEYAC